MTSSRRTGLHHGRPEYKPFDAMCEPGLISILFLSCGKHKIASASLASTAAAVRQYDGEVEWCFLEQGQNPEALDNLRMFEDFDAERKVVLRPNANYGINNGLNSLWAVSRGEYCMHHEDDWINKQSSFDFLAVAKEILDERSDIGIVQLRAVFDPHENWGIHKPDFNPWSCPHDQDKVFNETTESGHPYLLCEFPNGWNHNPQIVRKSLFLECGPLEEPPLNADLRHGETTMQARVAKSQCAIAHIGREVYYHGGGVARKTYEGC